MPPGATSGQLSWQQSHSRISHLATSFRPVPCHQKHSHTINPPRAQQHFEDSIASLSRVQVATVAPGLRGLITTEPVAQGRIALNVPFHNTLSVPLKKEAVIPWASSYLYPYEESHGYLPEALVNFLQCRLTRYLARSRMPDRP
jgi:hypothetical protein